MLSEKIKLELKHELRLAGQKWPGLFRHLDDEQAIEIIEKMKARRQANQSQVAAEEKRSETEEIPNATTGSSDTRQRQTGGGRRVIRGTRSLS